MPGQGWVHGRRYIAAILGVAVAFVARLWLNSVLGDGFVFAVFYPVVILAAYFGGVGPAIAAAVLSAALGYYAFAAPAFAVAFNAHALKSMAFFALNAAVNIYFITGMTKAMNEARHQRERSDMLAEGHADLFREFNERTTNHLQLVSALLQTRAGGELGSDAARALTEASRHSLMLSQVHRSLQDERDRTTNFAVFARQLVTSCLHAAGDPPIQIEVAEQDVHLPADQAASLAGVVFEWLRVILMQSPAHRDGVFHLALAPEHEGFRLSLRGRWDANEPGYASAPSMQLLDSNIVGALVDQLGGEFAAWSGPEGLDCEVAFLKRGAAQAWTMAGLDDEAPRSIH
jgi:two-component sensor histidine kinase